MGIYYGMEVEVRLEVRLEIGSRLCGYQEPMMSDRWLCQASARCRFCSYLIGRVELMVGAPRRVYACFSPTTFAHFPSLPQSCLLGESDVRYVYQSPFHEYMTFTHLNSEYSLSMTTTKAIPRLRRLSITHR